MYFTKKTLKIVLRVLKNIKYVYKLLAAAIKFNADPASNQPI
jgi:hypothetical protein